MPSIAESTSHRFGQHAGMKYYNRPKFLQAPDPSLLATPSFDVLNGKDLPVSSPIDWVGMPRVPMKPMDYYPVWLDDGPYGATYQQTSSGLLTLSNQSDALSFAAPLLLQGTEQVEPTILSKPTTKRNKIAHNSSNISTQYMLTGASCSDTHLHSPIVRPMKRARTNSTGQCWTAQDLVDSFRYENEYQCKRLRSENHVAQWYTEYLITVLIRAQYGENTPSTYVYNKLWKNIIRLLLDLRLSNSVVVLAFWYIHRIFPEGFMHPEVFTRSEGGMVAWRIFLLGIMLAEKWLEDGPHELKAWLPYFELPSNSVRALEQVFLGFFDHNISVSNSEWQSWIDTLEDHCRAKIRASHSEELQILFMDVLCGILDEAVVFSSERDTLRLLYKPESESYLVVLGLLQPYSSDEALEFTSSPFLLRKRSYLTAWNPAADPVVTARPRSSRIAPIARPVIRSAPALSSSALLHGTFPLPVASAQFGGKFYAPILT